MGLIKESYKFILIPIIFAVIVNIIIYRFELNKSVVKKNPKYNFKYGYIIGIIWMIIFGFIGYAYYLLYKESNKYFTTGTISIILFLIFSLSYPIITNKYTQFVDILNVVSLFLSILLTIIVCNEYRKSTKSMKILIYMLPLLAWVLFVNIYFESYKTLLKS
jgi:tryptophan-rich sensory protein